MKLMLPVVFSVHTGVNDPKNKGSCLGNGPFWGNPPENCYPVLFPPCSSNSKSVKVLIDLLVVVFNCLKAAGTSGYCYGP